jgi:hypothetical protein
MRVNLTNTCLLTLPLSLASARYCAAMLLLAIGVSLISAPVLADPPARVGRIGLVEGNVSFYTIKIVAGKMRGLIIPLPAKIRFGRTLPAAPKSALARRPCGWMPIALLTLRM